MALKSRVVGAAMIETGMSLDGELSRGVFTAVFLAKPRGKREGERTSEVLSFPLKPTLLVFTSLRWGEDVSLPSFSHCVRKFHQQLSPACSGEEDDFLTSAATQLAASPLVPRHLSAWPKTTAAASRRRCIAPWQCSAEISALVSFSCCGLWSLCLAW